MEGATMTTRKAIRILMLSPFYFRLPPENRKQLVKEFRESVTKIENKDKA
jgi:hypothetical protein